MDINSLCYTLVMRGELERKIKNWLTLLFLLIWFGKILLENSKVMQFLVGINFLILPASIVLGLILSVYSTKCGLV